MVRIAVALLSASFVMTGAAQADSYYDVEHARATARAGGPVSAYDAELLERHGATSGTPEWRRRGRDGYSSYYSDEETYRPLRRKVRRHYRHD